MPGDEKVDPISHQANPCIYNRIDSHIHISTLEPNSTRGNQHKMPSTLGFPKVSRSQLLD